MISIYKKYIYQKFFVNFLKVSFVFFVMIIIMNLFEEVKFLKDTDNLFLLPISLTLLNAPSVLFEILPFIILISTIIFFIELSDKNELIIYKTYGMTNINIIGILCSITFIIGLFSVVVFYNVSANLKFLYLEIKNNYAKDDKYLAVITGNGLLIRDKLDEKTNYINADKIQNESLLNISISQFNEDFTLEKVIIAEEAFIKEKKWLLKNVIINLNNNSQKLDILEFNSNFDIQRILKIFENFTSLDLFKIENLKKDYELLGYNTEILDGYKHKLYSYPIYLSLMVCIASILMIRTDYRKSKIFHIIFGILISVTIYYINHFFNVIIETQNIPYLISIWGPQLILLMVTTICLIRINEN